MADTSPEPGTGGPWAPPTTAGAGDDGATALARLLDADRTAVVVVGPDGRVENLNAAMLTLLDVGSIGEVGPGSRAHGEITAFLDQIPRALRHGETGSWSGDVDHHDRHGNTRVLRATAHVMASRAAGSRTSLLLHDVSDARRQLSALRQRATRDTLTGFVHRPAMLHEIAGAIDRAQGRQDRVAVISIDLDHFKHVNDVLGHEAGDRLLASSGHRLEQVLRPDDRVARVGGDEFLVMCRGVGDEQGAITLAERVERALRGTTAAGDLSVEVSASVGVAVEAVTDPRRVDPLTAAATLVGRAESAMYEARRLGGGRSMLHDPTTDGVGVDRPELAAALSKAIGRHALTVEYQPVFSLVSRRAVGAEALARWHHPTRGSIDPETFIAVAEQAGLITRLGEIVLDRAMSDLRGWIDAGVVGSEFTLHVNVSAAQLASPRIVQTVAAGLERHRLSPHQLVLEARETTLITRPVDVDRSIRGLRHHGVNVALDDFGIGPQALDLLTSIGADVLKLDGSLALPAGSSDVQTRLVRALVLLAHALDIGVVAERVDGLEQLQRLRAVGCDMVQGNLLGRPCTADELALTSAVTW